MTFSSSQSYPASVVDMISIARVLIARHEEADDIPSLFALLLATSHVADWVTKLNHGVDLAAVESGWFARLFPVWDPIRDLANRLKHAKRVDRAKLSRDNRVPSLDLPWESNGFWNGEAWAFKWDGEWRAVSRLCELLLDDFESRFANIPRPPLRV